MHSAKLFTRLLAATSLLVMSSAHAGIVSVSGAAVQMAAPGSVVPNAGFESYTQAAVFAEQQHTVLAQAAQLDATTSGLFDALVDLTPGSIAAGTRVSSYYLHADPTGSGSTLYTYIGSITFDSDILGIAALNAQLLSTDVLGAPGTAYPGSAAVNGLDFPEGTDSFTISADRRTLSFKLVAYAGADALRVVTEGADEGGGNTVPEPGSLFLGSMALGALVLTRRGQRQQA